MDQKRHRKTGTGPDRFRGIIIIVVAAVLAGIPFFVGKYMEFNFPDPYDSGGYVYSARHILDGAEIGVQENPSAQIGTLLVNIAGVGLFGFNETGPILIQAILQAAALILMFYSMRKLFGSLSAVVGVLIASVYLSAPMIAKFGNVKEQFMIAFMILGISCFILRQLDGRWWWALLAGAMLAWAPLFKQTGISAPGAVGLFVIAQPFFRHRTWKQTGTDILLLLGGAALSVGPIYVWMIAGDVKMALPYASIWKEALKILSIGGSAKAGQAGSRYVGGSREIFGFAKQMPVVLRYYLVLILPIAFAIGAILTRCIRFILRKSGKTIAQPADRFVLLLAVWWLLDMGFVWISPRSYEQYYLPLTASAAMLGGYLTFLYSRKFTTSLHKGKWVVVGALTVAAMIAMSWHIFGGIEMALHSGKKYPSPPYKRRGYVQRLHDIAMRKSQGAVGIWEVVGGYIRDHSSPDDTIYVWGWYPGIYVKAQRFSSAPNAFESEMHTKSPERLAADVQKLLEAFDEKRPKFIVDTRKRHFPWNRLPLVLWPRSSGDFLPADNEPAVALHSRFYWEYLKQNSGETEAARYESMKPFRQYVMGNYRVVRMFGNHVLFQLKADSAGRAGQ